MTDKAVGYSEVFLCFVLFISEQYLTQKMGLVSLAFCIAFRILHWPGAFVVCYH